MGSNTEMETFLPSDLDKVPKDVKLVTLQIELKGPTVGAAVIPPTCWHKFELPREPQSSVVRIHWRPCERRGEIRRHLHACGQGRIYEF